MKLTCLDLFSGIGGITHALRGLGITTVGYCERDPRAIAVLEARMKSHDLPRATIYKDVVALDGKALRGKVSVLTAGFPCQGFSMCGRRRGFRHEGSGLFSHVLRLIDQIQPSVVFLENVANICAPQMGGLRAVVAALATRDYDVRWVTLCAFHVGAPHRRERWFCLATKRKWTHALPVSASAYAPTSWTREPVARLTHSKPSEDNARMFMLGNSVVPDCVRLAFLYLWMGCPADDRHVYGILRRTRGKKVALRLPAAPAGAPANDCAAHGMVASSPTPKAGKRPVLLQLPEPQGLLQIQPSMRIVLDPSLVPRPARPPLSIQTTAPLTQPIAKPLWSTPRTGGGMSRTLTYRGAKDVATQLLFERRTPAKQRLLTPNPSWVDWLMGYAPGWTRSAPRKNVVLPVV